MAACFLGLLGLGLPAFGARPGEVIPVARTAKEVARPAADWRFGKATVNAVEEGLWVYCSLRNKGKTSEEVVQFFVVATPAEGKPVPPEGEPPQADLTRRTRGKRSAVFDDTIELKVSLRGVGSLELLVTVNGVVTDILPIRGGKTDTSKAKPAS